MISTNDSQSVSSTSGICDVTVKSLRQPEDSEEGGVQVVSFLTWTQDYSSGHIPLIARQKSPVSLEKGSVWAP